MITDSPELCVHPRQWPTAGKKVCRKCTTRWFTPVLRVLVRYTQRKSFEGKCPLTHLTILRNGNNENVNILIVKYTFLSMRMVTDDGTKDDD